MQSFSWEMILRSVSVSVQNKKHFWKSADFGVFFFGKMQNNPIHILLLFPRKSVSNLQLFA